jgi:hypothetical protein
MKPQNLKLELTSEVIKKDYDWYLDWNGREISGTATFECSDWSLEIDAFIDEDCLDGLTNEQIDEITSYVEANIIKPQNP